MRAFIKPHLYPALLGQHLVVLDLRTGAYDCILGVGADVEIHEGDELVSEDAELMAQLCQPPGHDAPGRFNRSAPSAPSVGVIDPDWATGRSWRSEITRASALAALSGRLRSFEDLLAEGRHGASELSYDEDAAYEITRGFLAGLPASPFQGECLFRTRVLRSLLHRRGCGTDWVFGVRLWPFRAHCWLQTGDLVLADDPDHVRLYAPLLVV